MAAVSTIIAAAGLAVAAAGTVSSIQGQKQAAKAQRRQIDLQNQAAAKEQQFREIQNARQRRQVIQEFYQKRAQSVAAGEARGASGGSAIAGAIGSLRTQVGSTAGFLDQASQFGADIGSLQQQASIFQGKALQGQSRANLGGAISNLGGTIFSNAGTIAGLFDSGPKIIPASQANTGISTTGVGVS